MWRLGQTLHSGPSTPTSLTPLPRRLQPQLQQRAAERGHPAPPRPPGCGLQPAALSVVQGTSVSACGPPGPGVAWGSSNGLMTEPLWTSCPGLCGPGSVSRGSARSGTGVPAQGPGLWRGVRGTLRSHQPARGGLSCSALQAPAPTAVACLPGERAVPRCCRTVPATSLRPAPGPARARPRPVLSRGTGRLLHPHRLCSWDTGRSTPAPAMPQDDDGQADLHPAPGVGLAPGTSLTAEPLQTHELRGEPLEVEA